MTLNIKMTRKYYVSDPEPDSNGQTGYLFMRTHRSLSKDERELRRSNAKKRAAELRLIMSDPVSAYDYQRDLIVKSVARRMEKDIKYRNWTRKQLYQCAFANYDNSDAPMRFNKHKTQQGPKPKKTYESTVETNAEVGNYAITKFDPDFIETVKSFRNARGLTQHDLGVLVNRTEPQIRAFEKGELPFDAAFKALLTWKLSL